MGTGIIAITYHRRKLRLREGPGCLEVPRATWLQFVLDLAHLTPPPHPALGFRILWAGADWCVPWGPGAQTQQLPGERAAGRLAGGPHCARSMELAPGSLN